RPVEALQRLQTLSQRLPDEVKVWTALVYVRTELGLWSDVLPALDELERLDPNQSELQRAPALEVLGRIDEAAAVYRRCAATPERLAALVGLADLRPSDVTVDEKRELAAAARSPDTDIELRIRVHFALGEIEERAGDADAAFAEFAAGNRLKREILTGERPGPAPKAIEPSRRTLDPRRAAEEQRAAIAFREAVFTADFMAAQSGRGHHIAAPIFIVGMPRSGSTLLEQILSSHRRVQGLGETLCLHEAVQGRFPLNLFAPNPPDHFRAMAEAYFRAMHSHGWGSAPRFVDKALNNYIDVGLIHLTMPKAVILHSVRDPVDTCLA